MGNFRNPKARGNLKKGGETKKKKKKARVLAGGARQKTPEREKSGTNVPVPGVTPDCLLD